MTRVLVATTNPGKLKEFAEALAAEGIDVKGLDSLADRTEVAETESTFEANARLKAEGYSRRTEWVVLAEDSGLEVDAIAGAPGVHSARYGGPSLDDAGRNRKLLDDLRDVREPDRTARFRCALAVAHRGRTLALFAGAVEGRITRQLLGAHGFGYDPLFFHPPSGCTTGELTTEQKRRVSHRGQAIAAFVRALRARDPRLAAIG